MIASTPDIEPRAGTARVIHRVCTRCVMDTSDSSITFDADGVCSHCHRYARLASQQLRQHDDGRRELDALVARIRADGRDRPYDCVMGVSGGVDSTYTAFIARQLGLRPLAVHMDNGWDSELAVSNIEKVLNKLSIDLYTSVLDWEEFKDLQLSFLKASVPDAEIPTDHAIGAVIYQLAAKQGIRWILSGSNIVTEGVLPGTWTYGIWDWKYIRSIQARFGRRRLRTLPHYSLVDLYRYTSVKRIRTLRPLNYLPYVKNDVMNILQHELGWQYYGGKHYESIYTRFFQGFILPRKFDIDKRKAHLSSLICSGQTTREDAVGELQSNTYTDALQKQDREYVLKKLELSDGEFHAIMRAAPRTHADYPNSERLIQTVKNAARLAQRAGLLRVDGPI